MNSERILWWLCISIIITIEIVSGQRVSGKDFFQCMVLFFYGSSKMQKNAYEASIGIAYESYT